jgi:hypothetical protein
VRTQAQAQTKKPWDVGIPRLFHFSSSAMYAIARIRFQVRTEKKRPGLLRRLAWCLHEGV